MNINTLYVNGCSWTAGNEIDCDPLFEKYLKSNNLKYLKEKWSIVDLNDNYVCPPSDMWSKFNWATKVGENLCIKNIINEAYGGGSNQRIVRMTVDYVLKYPKDKINELLIIIGWTSSDRREIYIKNHKRFEFFNPTHKFSQTLTHPHGLTDDLIVEFNDFQEKYVDLLHDDYECSLKYFQQIYLLSNLLDNLKVKYLFFNSFADIGGAFLKNKDEFQLNHFYDWYMSKNEILSEKTLLHFMCENNYPEAPFRHPMIEAHQNWGDYLVNKLKERKII